MLRGLILAVAVALLLAGGAAGRTASGSPVAFVTLPERSQLVAVDLFAERERGRVAVPLGPRSIAWFHDAARARPFLLVTSPDAGAVSLIDAGSMRIVRVWRDFGRPYDVDVEGLFAYVTDEARGELVRIDLRGRRVRDRVAVGARPRELAVSDVAVVSHAASGRLTTVATWCAHLRIQGRLSLGEPVRDLAEQPDSAWAYATLGRSGRVVRLDWGTRRVDWMRRVGSSAGPLAFDHHDGRRLWTADADGLIQFTSRDGGVLRRLEGCPGVSGIALGGTMWVTAACADKRLAVWHTRHRGPTLYWLGARPAGVTVAVVRVT